MFRSVSGSVGAYSRGNPRFVQTKRLKQSLCDPCPFLPIIPPVITQPPFTTGPAPLCKDHPPEALILKCLCMKKLRIHLACSVLLAFVSLARADEPWSANTPTRSVDAVLPSQEFNPIKTAWPGIACWFWSGEEFQPEGYKRFLDLYARHSAARLLTTSIRHPVEVTDPKVHDQIQAAAEYARSRGMEMVMDLDVRLARGAFQVKYPTEMQEIVRLREISLTGTNDAVIAIEPINLGDHYTGFTRGYESISARLLRACSYERTRHGIDPSSVRDISARVKVMQADAKGVRVSVPAAQDEAGRTACILAAFTLFTPDVFAPHLIQFERATLEQYRDVPLAGACKDEWGFPGRFEPRIDDVYFSPAMADAYNKRRPGHDLVRDLPLMVFGERGREAERIAAINHYQEMVWQRNAEVENAFYDGIKHVFGPHAMAATHPTWYPYPGKLEVFKNGLHWWAARRDLAQTDESTPFAARTALAKKWHSPVWYNMYYQDSLAAYEADLWPHLLGGGRMNFHPIWPHPWEKLTTSLLGGDLLRADARVRLVNFISTAPIDCPVAVVFGHPAALNYAGPGFADSGMVLADGLWAEGYYADLIPSSEICSGHLTLAPDGRVQYGPQRYAAVVLYHPQFERLKVAEFFSQAVNSNRTVIHSLGDWTTGFEGNPLPRVPLPAGVIQPKDPADCVRRIVSCLRTAGIEPQTPAALRNNSGFPSSMAPPATGRSRLLDGTIILASGQHSVLGDLIQTNLNVGGHAVKIQARGVVAFRLDPSGKLTALAAGGLRSFNSPGFNLELPEAIDLACWMQEDGRWRGVLQGITGPIPPALLSVTRQWKNLALPVPYRE